MLKQLKKMKREYDDLIANNDMAASRFEEPELMEWIASCMHLAGYSLTKSDVEKVLTGEGTGGGTIEEYLLIQRYIELLSKFRYMREMSIEIDQRYLNEIYMTLTDSSSPNFRKNQASLFGYSYYPPLSSEIKSKMTELMRMLSDTSLSEEPVIKAVFLHNKIFEIQPYENKNDAVAYAAMSYELYRNGYPLPSVKIKREDYLVYMKECLVNGKVTGLLFVVAEVLLNQMKVKIKKE